MWERLRKIRFSRRRGASVAGGCVAVLALGGVVAWVTQPEQRLLRLLPRLPDSVVMVFWEYPPQGLQSGDPLSRELLRLLPGLKDGDVRARPRAVLLIRREKKLHAVAVYSARDLRGIVHDGRPWHGFLLLGDPVTVEHLRAEPLSRPVAAIRQFLSRASASYRHALLVRQQFLAELVPLFRDVDAGSWDLLRWTGDPTNVTFEIISEGNPAWLVASGKHLPLSLPVPLVALDGFPGSIMVPENLPPVLDALRATSGLDQELLNLQHALRDTPVSVAIFDDSPSVIPVVTARLQPGSEAVITALVRDLLVKRLSALFAEETTARGPRGERIRHREPADGASLLRVDVSSRGTLLSAPCGAALHPRTIVREECFAPAAQARAARAPDLVAFIGEELLVISTRESWVQAMVTSSTEISDRADARDVLVTVDGEKLRRFPAVAVALDTAPGVWRSWLKELERLRLVLSPDPQGIIIRGTVSFHSP